MKWRDWLEKWGMTSLKITPPFLEMEWQPQDADKAAAWELYIELLTRITTQPLPDEHGREDAALASVYSLFAATREIIRRNGRGCAEFTKIAVVVLNQVIRPFTSNWHGLATEGALEDHEVRTQFRAELVELQRRLRKYSHMLAEMAGVEDLTSLERADPT